jgi:hypothetical protein
MLMPKKMAASKKPLKKVWKAIHPRIIEGT